jgi:hypothetical protein
MTAFARPCHPPSISRCKRANKRRMSNRRKKSLARRILLEKEKVRLACERVETLTQQLRDGVDVDREIIELDPLTRYQSSITSRSRRR